MVTFKDNIQSRSVKFGIADHFWIEITVDYLERIRERRRRMKEPDKII